MIKPPIESKRRICGLYAVTPEEADTGRLVRKVVAALEGGAAVVQYRAKQASPALAQIQARELHKRCQEFGVPLIINDSLEIALAVGAEGVHLGRLDGAIDHVRKKSPDMIIGVSCYNSLDLAGDALQQGADYVAFGSFFPSSTKPEALRASVDLLRRVREQGYNTVAIGGITCDNAGTLIAGGADAIAVINALFGSGDMAQIRATAQTFTQLFCDA